MFVDRSKVRISQTQHTKNGRVRKFLHKERKTPSKEVAVNFTDQPTESVGNFSQSFDDLELEDLSRVLVVGLVFVVQLFLRLKLYTGDNFKPPSTDVAVRAEKLWQADLTKYNL